jgi:hypothetical protein
LRVNGADVSENAELCDSMLLASDDLEIVFRGLPKREGLRGAGAEIKMDQAMLHKGGKVCCAARTVCVCVCVCACVCALSRVCVSGSFSSMAVA